MKTFIRKKVGRTTTFRLINLISDPVMTRQRKPEETYCNFANLKRAVDSKTNIKQNGVQIIKNLSRIYESKLIIYFCFLRILTLKSTSRLSDFDLISAPFLCLGFQT